MHLQYHRGALFDSVLVEPGEQTAIAVDKRPLTVLSFDLGNRSDVSSTESSGRACQGGKDDETQQQTWESEASHGDGADCISCILGDAMILWEL